MLWPIPKICNLQFNQTSHLYGPKIYTTAADFAHGALLQQLWCRTKYQHTTQQSGSLNAHLWSRHNKPAVQNLPKEAEGWTWEPTRLQKSVPKSSANAAAAQRPGRTSLQLTSNFWIQRSNSMRVNSTLETLSLVGVGCPSAKWCMGTVPDSCWSCLSKEAENLRCWSLNKKHWYTALHLYPACYWESPTIMEMWLIN